MRQNEEREYAEFRDRVIEAAMRPRASIVIFGVARHGAILVSDLHHLGLGASISGVCDQNTERKGSWIFNHEVSSPEEISWEGVTCIAIGENMAKDEVIASISRINTEDMLPDVAVLAFGIDHFSYRDERFWGIVSSAQSRSGAGGYRNIVPHLFECLEVLASTNPSAAIVEVGVGRGGTSELLARSIGLFGMTSCLWLLDTFEGFPGRRHNILDTYTLATDEGNSPSAVANLVESYASYKLIQGDVCDTANGTLAEQIGDIGLIFVDVDNYSPTMAALTAFASQVVVGGFIVFDHFYSPEWPGPLGERAAALKMLKPPEWFNLHGTGVFIRRL